MTDALWTRLADIVPEALACPAEARDAFLDAACRDATGSPDLVLRREADSLVAASIDADATGALVSPVATHAATPERLGPWRLMGRLGEGGMGVVYRAARADGAFEREVALKRLHPALGHALSGRLDAERRTLARLEHPGIARLYDGGVDDHGAPYLVMERVDGQPITDHADAAGLDVAARVRLFAEVCDAVAYAHRHLVVHRDLKPSNVFVSGDGRPKLLDFGIAKLLGEADGGGALGETLTRTQAAMTPSYAAPEQLRRGEITTATDVYALGVMLYELLAGQRPYALTNATPAESEALICETVPLPPSAVAPPERARALRGDLDTIVGTALAKEPARRYASAEALADDLRRHLDGLPVRARPATAGYRARRFVRRHRLGVAAAALIALALVAGATVALWQARVARAEAAKAEAVNGFLVGLLGAASPEADGRDVRVASLLDQAAADLDSTFTGPPDVEATLRHTLGVTYRELGLYREADTQLRRALALRERRHGPRHADVSQAQYDLGGLYRLQGDYRAADSLFSRALATDRALFGDQSARVSLLLNDLGVLRYQTGDLADAERLYRESLAIDQTRFPPDHPDVLIGIGNVATALAEQGKRAEAAALFERQLAVLRASHPDDDESIGNALANLGSVYYESGRGEDAARLHREAVARFRRALGDDHDYVGFAMNNLGSTLASIGEHGEAERVLRAAIANYRAALGERHPNLTFPLVNLGMSLRDQGRLGEAEAMLRDGVVLAREGFGAEHPVLARALVSLGTVLVAQNRAAEAVGVFREALAIRRAALPAGHPDRFVTASLLGDALRRSGQTAEAERWLVASHAALARAAAQDSTLHDRLADAAARLADLRADRAPRIARRHP